MEIRLWLEDGGRSSLVILVEVILEVEEAVGGFWVQRKRRVDVPGPHRVHPVPVVVAIPQGRRRRRRRRSDCRLVDRSALEHERLPRENEAMLYFSK